MLRHVGSLYILTYDARKLKHKISRITQTLNYVNMRIIRMVTRLAGRVGGNTAAISYNTVVPDEFN